MVSAADVIDLYTRLTQAGIRVWVGGGWGIDALLGEQTRPHKDLDTLMLLDDMLRVRSLLGEIGFSFKELWSENLPGVDAQGNETPTAFVIWNPDGREIDVHALHLDEAGNGLPAWTMPEGFQLTKEELSGQGCIAGVSVHCITAECQVRLHQGYTLPEAQQRDMELLKERFGIE